MHEALTLLSDLDERDLAWFFQNGREEVVSPGTPFVVEGSQPAKLYVVLSGLVGVRIGAEGTAYVARPGPGEILGEMSLLEGSPASATLVTLEPTTLLAISQEVLKARLSQDPSFGARFYRALARLNARRLRTQVGAGGRWPDPSEAPPDAARRALAESFDEFKELMQRAGEEAKIRDRDPVTEHAAAARTLFTRMVADMSAIFGDGAPGTDEQHAALGRTVQREFLPYMLLSRFGERCYTKPRGYAGDYLTIEWMYRNEPSGQGAVGTLIDDAMLASPPCRAIRNRRRVLSAAILETVEGVNPRPARIASFACGPAEEVFDVLEAVDSPERLDATLVDIDRQALDHVAARIEREGRGEHLSLQQSNLVYLATGQEALPVSDLDLVYSIGLIDYFEDKWVIALLDYVHGLLAPGGRVILGNFRSGQSYKVFMDHIFDWRLHHRSEDDMNRLYAASRFAVPCTRILYEQDGINLFAECIKT